MTTEKHVHKYVRVRIGVRKKATYYKCAIAGCVHKIDPPLAVGRESICNYCGSNFFMGKASIRLAKPHCGCRNQKKVAAIHAIEEFLSGKL